MKILIKRESELDPTYVESSTLLQDKEDKSVVLGIDNRLDLVETIVSNLPELNKENISDAFITDRVFNITNPIDISALPDVESFINTPGILYYDKTNNRLRFRKTTGWVTINT